MEVLDWVFCREQVAERFHKADLEGHSKFSFVLRSIYCLRSWKVERKWVILIMGQDVGTGRWNLRVTAIGYLSAFRDRIGEEYLEAKDFGG